MVSGWGTHLFLTYTGSSCIPFPTAASAPGQTLAFPGTWLLVVGTLLAQQPGHTRTADTQTGKSLGRSYPVLVRLALSGISPWSCG